MPPLDSLNNFKQKYPSVTIADLQTFVIGYNSAIEDMKEIFEQLKNLDGHINNSIGKRKYPKEVINALQIISNLIETIS